MTKLLLIDDEPDILRVLSRSLRADGYEVMTAPGGREAMEIYRAESPSIVLTDLKMPGMDGIEVLQKIKEFETDTQVIIITGHGDIDAAIEALHFGASDFINKPVKDEALSIALRRAEEKIEIQQRLRDYTENLENMVRIATREVERKSDFQEKLIRSSNDGIIATDEDWQVVIYNPGAQRIFGYKREEVVNNFRVEDLFPETIFQMFEEKPPSTDDDTELPRSETVIVSKSGETIPVRVYGTLLHERQKVMGSVAFFQDLREIKRLERELVSTERLAAIGQTVAGLAHCIKNILHGFKGGSYLVNVGIDKNNTDKLKNGWQMIQRNIHRTSDLILDLLSYSKEREPEVEVCRPNEIANDICQLLSENAEDYGIVLEKDFSPEIEEAVMDPKTVYRCLLNLASNAVDACIFDENSKEHHWVRVSTKLDNVENRILFSVEDNGSGMKEEVKAKLFTSFFSTKGAKGTGLGLLVTNKLIEEHGGMIDVESTEGQGTVFTIQLPFTSAER